jgi:hypothetical protein
MLLIGQPKSATTSLAHTIGITMKLNINLGIPRTKIDINCEGYPEIQRYHNNMIERSPQFIQQIITGRKTLFKEHLLPTDRHFKIIEKIKGPVVILLRDVDDSLDSYKRIIDCDTADLQQLKEDLYQFHNRWMLWKSNKPYAIVIEYRDLILNFHHEFKRICKCFKLPIPKNINKMKLHRKKFTGVGLERLKNAVDSTTKEC